MVKYEARIPLPMSMKEYEKGYTYSYTLAAREANKKGDGDIEVEVSESPFDNLDGHMGISKYTSYQVPVAKGYYSRKKYNLGTQVPGYVKMIVPANVLLLIEESWFFPDPDNGELIESITVLVSCYFKHTTLKFVSHTKVRDNDNGRENKYENIFNLDEAQLKARKVEHLDIFEQDKTDNAYDEKYDPALHNSGPKSNRTIEKDWIEKKSDAYPTCCVYKNCSIDFRVWGITNKAEKYCMEFQLGVFKRVAGMAFCAMDQYIDLSMEDVMKMWINNHKVLKELRDKRLAASESENDNNTTSDNNQNANSKPSVSDTTTKETSQ